MSVVRIAGQKTAVFIDVFTEPEAGWMVQAIAPQLHGSQLKFLKLYAPPHEVDIVEAADLSSNIDDRVMAQLSAPVQELYGHLDPKVFKLKRTIEELEDLATLTRSSEIYFKQAALYDRAIHQLALLLEEAITLQASCCSFIREILIGAEVSIAEASDFLPDTLAWKLEFQAKYKSITEQYQMLSDEVEALSQISSSID